MFNVSLILAFITSQVEKMELVGYSDSDSRGSLDDWKSTSDSCFTIGRGLITWRLSKQGLVDRSSTEAKYITSTSVSAQALCLRKMLEEIGEKQTHPTIFLVIKRVPFN